MLAIMINRLTINLHQWGKGSVAVFASGGHQPSVPPTWMINTQNNTSHWAEMNEEMMTYASHSRISYDGTNGVELVNIGRSIR